MFAFSNSYYVALSVLSVLVLSFANLHLIVVFAKKNKIKKLL